MAQHNLKDEITLFPVEIMWIYYIIATANINIISILYVLISLYNIIILAVAIHLVTLSDNT